MILVTTPATIDAAMQGVSTVVLVSPAIPVTITTQQKESS